MRARTHVLTAATAALAISAVAAPTSALAQKHGSGGGSQISINVTPNPDIAGDPMVIFGRLTGPHPGNQDVKLWHRINPAPRFTIVQHVRTDANGFYLINRADGVVKTNRNWYVRADGARSRTVHEKAQPIVKLTPSTTTAQTNHPVTFSGSVFPARAGQVVVLQRQVGNDGEDWKPIAGTATKTAADGSFSITKNWRVPDTYTVRARVRADRRNIAAESDSVDITVNQTTNPNLTLSASADPISIGDNVTLTGVLAGADAAGKNLTLYAHTHGNGYTQVAVTQAGSDGSYSFTQTPVNTTAYQVRADGGKPQSAQVFVAVHDVLTAALDKTTAATGETITFTGSVTPDKTGHKIELQRQGEDGDWHTVQIATVGAGSQYSIAHVVGSPGQKVFRVHITGGPFNWGDASQPFTVTVTDPTATTPQVATS